MAKFAPLCIFNRKTDSNFRKDLKQAYLFYRYLDSSTIIYFCCKLNDKINIPLTFFGGG